MGDPARRDEARRGGHPGHDAAHRGRPARPARPRRVPGTWWSAAADAAKFDGVEGDYTRIAVRGAPEGWLDTPTRTPRPTAFVPDGVTRGSDTLLLYFTSGTTAKPKLVEHTPRRPTRSGTCRPCTGSACSRATCTSTSPRRAGPSTRGATSSRRGSPSRAVLVMNYARFDATSVLGVLDRCGVTSFCAPPTVWRMLIQADLSGLAQPAVEGRRRGGAAQPRGDRAGRQGLGRADPRRLRPDREPRCRSATRRGSRSSPARWAVPSPAIPIALIDPATGEPAEEGEICIDPRPSARSG